MVTALSPVPDPRRPALVRPVGRGLLGGVATGIATHLRVSVWAIRLCFLVLMGSWGMGIVLYVVFWIVLPTDRPARPERWWKYALVGLVTTGALVSSVETLPVGRLFIPGALACVGAALIWRQASESQRAQWWHVSRRSLTASEHTGRLRLLAGIVLIGLGGAFVFGRADYGAMRDGLVAAFVTLVGIALITGPWWVRMVTELGRERRERIRSQERAEIAAKLHDSVLQTLALIQRNAGSPREVARLARSQERELRSLLYGFSVDQGEFGQALRELAAEMEDAYAIHVDTVVVGEVSLDDDLRAVLGATREALQNAGKHAKVTDVSVYAEVERGAVVVYVRDRGAGFEPEQVRDDRQGLQNSIVGRIRRHGGEVSIRSAPDEGTEVTIRMPLT